MSEITTSAHRPPQGFAVEAIPHSLLNRSRSEVDLILHRPENFQGRTWVNGLVIDPENEFGEKSQDRDDAIWVEQVQSGYLVHISVADVAEYVKEGSAIDSIAQLKGFSQYDSRCAIDPMLPHALSEGKLSLIQGNARLTMTISVLLDNELNIEGVDIARTFLRSPYDFSYREAALAREDSSHEFYEQLVLADRLARKLRRKRHGKSEEGESEEAGRRDADSRMHHMIEEYMVLANQAVADFARERYLPIVYRNHRYEGVVYGTEGAGYYSDAPEGHEALGLEGYVHCTSPLRRYADLYVWRVMKRYLLTEQVRERDILRAQRVARRITMTERGLGLTAS